MEGIAIAFVTQYLMGKNTNIKEIAMITLTITVTLFLLDKYAPGVGQYTRQGVGFNIGRGQIGGADGEFVYDGIIDPALAEVTGYADGSDVAVLPVDFSRDRPVCSDEDSPQQLLEGMDDKVAIDYYSHDRIPTDNSDCHPEVGSQVNMIERFMDDRVAMNYYSQDRQPTSCGRDIHQESKDRILATQRGGAGTENAYDASSNSDIYSNYTDGPGQTVGQRGLVYGNLTIAPNQEHLARIKQTVYSGDLVNIFADGNKLVLLSDSKFVRAVPSDKIGLDDKFFKLRFQAVTDHRTDKMIPLTYGNGVYIKFNDETSQEVLLNHSGDLNSLSSQRDNIFELVNKDLPTSMSVVSFADNILLRRSVEGQPLRYFKINTERARVETTADLANATVFSIQPQKGCGPLWRFDSDTRTTNTFNSSQVRDIVNARTQLITDQLNSCQSSLRTSKGLAENPKMPQSTSFEDGIIPVVTNTTLGEEGELRGALI